MCIINTYQKSRVRLSDDVPPLAVGEVTTLSVRSVLTAVQTLGLLGPVVGLPVAEMVPDVGDFAVDGDSVVVERGSLKDDSCGAHADSQSEDPQEQSVQHHGHVFPVLFHLGNIVP